MEKLTEVLTIQTYAWKDWGPKREFQVTVAAWLLGPGIRILLGALMSVFVLYVVLSCVGRGTCDGLITSQKESYRVSKIDYETSGVRPPRSLQGL
jgi:hypothetical protein